MTNCLSLTFSVPPRSLVAERGPRAWITACFTTTRPYAFLVTAFGKSRVLLWRHTFNSHVQERVTVLFPSYGHSQLSNSLDTQLPLSSSPFLLLQSPPTTVQIK
jgi:hypothetical protein